MMGCWTMCRRISGIRIMWMMIMAGVVLSAEAETMTLMEHITFPEGLAFCGEPVDYSQDVRERFEKEMLLTLWDRPQVILWLKRSTRYLPLISDALAQRGMPDDLKYLAIAESALRPHAGSSKGAVGYWQLLPQTARNYGLEVNEFIDQRREIHAATNAALDYLQALYQKFGAWTLAAAGYNMGEEGLAAEILEQNTKDYYRLYLPIETQRFIFRILAVKRIVENPQGYGFSINLKDMYRPIQYEQTEIDCFQNIPIRLVAEAAQTDFKRIKDLNPHLRGHYLRQGHHTIHLPVGSTKGFKQKFAQLVSAYDTSLRQRIYIVQQGDSLSTIAQKFDVPLAALLIWNRLDMHRPIHPGDRLVIHSLRMEQIDSE